MSASQPPGPEVSWRERLRYALELESKTQTSVQTAMMAQHPDEFPNIFISRYLNGKTGATRPDPVKVKLLAEHLHVEVLWLLYGDGPVRRDGRDRHTPFEEAMRVARSFGFREDAIQIAWERNKDREGEMDARAWFEAIQAEGYRLTREGVPDPLVVAGHQLRIRETKARLKNDRARAKAAKASTAAGGEGAAGKVAG